MTRDEQALAIGQAVGKILIRAFVLWLIRSDLGNALSVTKTRADALTNYIQTGDYREAV